MIFAIADEVGDWLRAHNAPAAGAAAAYDGGGGLRRQGSSGGADESGAAVEYRKGQRRKQRRWQRRLLRTPRHSSPRRPWWNASLSRANVRLAQQHSAR